MYGGDLSLDYGELLRFAAAQPCTKGGACGNCTPCTARERLNPEPARPVTLESYGRTFTMTREELLGEQPGEGRTHE